MAGRPRITYEQKQIQGSLNVTRDKKPTLIPTLSLETEPPSDLNEWGAALWRKIYKHYAPLGVLSTIDEDSLLVMCSQFGIYCEACDLLAAQGLQIEEDVYKEGCKVGTRTVNNPIYKVVSDSFKNYKSMCLEFGMTPASRARIAAPEKVNESKFAEFEND
jgi:P27 family predicted phage terminase small subunit